ncbi:DUF4214 domain-containing protein [Pseudoduganella sp. FT93W]|uniref:DUF4214 domain-containing protein n=1 Tax=Duganella fentianensis TaxID=2692177 RepID=A0A845I5K6_9BURK|nr:DUF4214 domain-containing protein [Duganella fentianensis]
MSLITVVLAACGGSDVETSPRRTAGLRAGGERLVVQPALSVHSDLVQSLYLAFYGRAPDIGGLVFWTGVFDRLNLPSTASALIAAYGSDSNVKMVLDSFGRSPEATMLYPGTNAEFVNGIYMNLFGRYADNAGRMFWGDALDNRLVTRSFAALNILVGAQGEDQIALTKKNEVATRFLAALVAAGVTDNSPQGSAGVDLLWKVNAATDLKAFQTQIDAAVQKISQEIALQTLRRYTGFQNVFSETATLVRYWLTFGSGTVSAPNGKLVFGLGEREIGFAGPVPGSNVIAYAPPVVAFSAIDGAADGTTPTILMLCQAANDGTGGVSNKSTDVLVINLAEMITNAKDLAGQTLSMYREDCGVLSARNIVFDATGGAVVRDVNGSHSYSFTEVQTALTGRLTDGVDGKKYSWRAYRYTKADGSPKYAIVSRVIPNQSMSSRMQNSTISGTETAPPPIAVLSIWSQE